MQYKEEIRKKVPGGGDNQDYDGPDPIQLKVNNEITNEKANSSDPDDNELVTDPYILEVDSSNKVYAAYAGSPLPQSLTVISLPGYDNRRQPIVLHGYGQRYHHKG